MLVCLLLLLLSSRVLPLLLRPRIGRLERFMLEKESERFRRLPRAPVLLDG